MNNQSKKVFSKNFRFILEARENILNSFKSNIFLLKNQTPIPTTESTPEPTSIPTVFDTPKPRKTQTKKSKHKISSLKLREMSLDKIVNDEKI